MAAATTPEINRSQVIRDYFTQNPTAHAKKVVAALAKKGITVSEGHVYVVKGKMKLTQKRQAKETAAKANTNGSPAKPVKTIASPDAPNKSESIRGLLKESPKATVDEVISSLAAKGIKVKKGLVYMVKSSMKSRKRRQAKEKVATEMVAATKKTATTSNGTISDPLTTIKQVKELAAKLGGMKTLKALVDALSE